MGAELIIAIVGAVAGIIGAVVSASSQASTNQANQQMTDSTNFTNAAIAQNTNAINKEIADENLQFEQEKFNYDKALQQQIFEREDTAYQRTVNDMMSAGISPLSMSGTNSAGSVVSTKAPQNGFVAQPWQAIAPQFFQPHFDGSFTNHIMSLVPELLDYKLKKEKQDVELGKIVSETKKNESDSSYTDEYKKQLSVIQEKLKEEVESLDLSNKEKKRLLDEIEKYDYSSVNLEYGTSQTKGAEIGVKSVIREAVELNEDIQEGAMKTEQFESGKENLNKISAYSSVARTIPKFAYTEFNTLYQKRNSPDSPYTKEQFQFLYKFFNDSDFQSKVLNSTDSVFIKENSENIKALLSIYESAYHTYLRIKERGTSRQSAPAS